MENYFELFILCSNIDEIIDTIYISCWKVLDKKYSGLNIFYLI